MLMINVIDNVSDYQTESLTQWDANQKLKISGVSFSTVPAIHFANKKSEKALVITPTLSSGVITVDIPNSLLREPYPIVAFVYSYDNDSGSTELSVTIPIIPRIQPDDYAFIDDDGLLTLSALNARVYSLETTVYDESGTISGDQDYTELENKIKALISVNSNISIAPSDWTDNSYTINYNKIVEGSIIDVYYNSDSKAAITDADPSYTVGVGYITITVNSVPTETIVIDAVKVVNDI